MCDVNTYLAAKEASLSRLIHLIILLLFASYLPLLPLSYDASQMVYPFFFFIALPATATMTSKP